MAMQSADGSYLYTPGLRFASSAVLAQEGYTIERGVLPAPVPLPGGYDAVARHLHLLERPMSALCGVELRMPASLPVQEFTRFNNEYLGQLDEWGLLIDGIPPLTRTNVCPRTGVDAPCLLAFSYTVERQGRAPAFVVSGVADLPAGGSYPDDIVRRGETSEDALREKTLAIVEDVDSRIRELGIGWTDDASVHLYSLHDLSAVLRHELLPKVGVRPVHGLTWHDTAPPTAELELEIDVRAYDREVYCAPS